MRELKQNQRVGNEELYIFNEISSQTINTSARQIWPKKMKQNAYHHKIFDKFPSSRKKHYMRF